MSTIENRKFNPIILVVLLAVVLLGGGIFVMTKNQQASKSTSDEQMSTELTQLTMTPVASPEGTPATDDESDSNVKIIAMEAGSFFYKPNTITVKKGEKVKITMTSKDMMHDFNVDELDIHSPITKSGDTATIEFTANEVGEFEYYCSVGNHKQMGQVGKLIVQ